MKISFFLERLNNDSGGFSIIYARYTRRHHVYGAHMCV